jgi:hypothetical protein
MKTRLTIFILTSMLVLFVVACGGGEDPTVAFCDAMTELNEAGSTIAALGEVADLPQIVQLGTAMDNNWIAVSSAVEQLDEATQTAFAPYDEQYTAIPAITQETAMPIGRTSLDAKNAIATEAYNELYPGLCQ